MAQAVWEKPSSVPVTRKSSRAGFVLGGVLILAAVIYLITAGTMSNAQYFITVDTLMHDPQLAGHTVRVTGAVIGDTIVYDAQNLIIDFVVAHIPTDTLDLAQTLHDATLDPNVARMRVRVENQVKPDLLQHEAQAIMTGRLGADGIFYADELLLKCPSRFEENDPNHAIATVEGS